MFGGKIKFPEECWAGLEENHPQMKKELESILNGTADESIRVIHNDFLLNTEEEGVGMIRRVRCILQMFGDLFGFLFDSLMNMGADKSDEKHKFETEDKMR